MNYFLTILTAAHIGPFLSIFLASFIQSITGFGLVIIASPFLLLFYDAKFAILLVLLIALCSNCVQSILLYRDADKKLAFWLLAGALFGIPAGLYMYHMFPNNSLKLLVGCSILIFLLITHFLHPILRITPKNSLKTGLLSGFLYTTTGMGGPPLILYFAFAKLSPALQRATCILYFLFGNIISLLGFMLSGVNLQPAIHETITLLPALALGLLLGHKVFPYVSAAIFRRIILVMLYVACFYTIYSTLCR